MSRASWIIVAAAVVVVIATHAWSYFADRRVHRRLDAEAADALSSARRPGR